MQPKGKQLNNPLGKTISPPFRARLPKRQGFSGSAEGPGGDILERSHAAGARCTQTALRAANTAVGAVYLVVGVLGLFILDSSANILALNGADNGLHLVSGAVLLGVGLFADKARPQLISGRGGWRASRPAGT